MAKQDLPVKKNDLIEVDFHDLNHEGAGVGKYNGYTLFVPRAIPGEKGVVKVIKTKKGYGFGRLMELKKTSSYRQDAPCYIYKECGGCQLQHISYEGQLHYKQKQVQDVMERIGKLEDVAVHPVLGMEEPWRYRNKAQVPVGEEDGELIAGFFRKRSHNIINMDECIVQEPPNDKAIQTIKEIMKKYNVKPYHEKTHKGTLRHIITKLGKETDQVMVVLVTRTKDIPNRKRIVEEIVECVPNVRSVVQNVNPKRTNVIFGDDTRVLWGTEYIYDLIGDIKFAISARSFYQVNPDQTKVLYEKALQYAELTGEETVIDAYCGIGTISLFLAQKAKKVYGVEIVREAIEDAERNAELNEMTNAEFKVGKAEEVIPTWYDSGIRADVIVVDPPRKGCDEKLLQTIVNMKPNRVVYVSCNPATLARDLRYLEDHGYKTQDIQPVDMFPQTTHVECVSQIVLKEEAGAQ